MVKKITRELAFAASLDAGDESMRKAGRTEWSRADQTVASTKFNYLWPRCKHLLEPNECPKCT